MKKVIVIPGLGDHVEMIKWACRNWPNYGVRPIIYNMDWKKEESFNLKLDKLSNFINTLAQNDEKISVVGCSAGASAALNLFLERPDIIDKAVSVCGRLKVGKEKGFRSLKNRAKSSSAFAESVKLFEEKSKDLSDEKRKMIMTIRSLLLDELVPSSTSILEGAENIVVPTAEHSITIYRTLSTFNRKILDFLQPQINEVGNSISKIDKDFSYRLNMFVANMLFVVHFMFGLFIIFGWLFYQIKPVYLVAMLGWILSWIFLGYCPFTKWEFTLRSKYNSKIDPNAEAIKYYLDKFFNLDVPSEKIFIGGLTVFCILIILTFIF